MNQLEEIEILYHGTFYYQIKDGRTYIYDSDYNEFLMKFETLTRREIKLIITYFFSGFEHGKQAGREEKENEIKKVLGL